MKEKSSALADNIDKAQLKEVHEHVLRNSKDIDDAVNILVAEYCSDLDAYMETIDDILTQQETPVTDYQLDDFTLNLPSLLYFTSSAQEALGIKEDVSKAIRNDVYNRVREKAQGTVADKDTAAELQSQAETIVNIVYNRAYKKVKLRIEAAYEMLNSVKKVMTRRIAEYGITQREEGRSARE